MSRAKPTVLWLSRAANLERQAAVAPTACQRADLLAVAAGHRRHVGQDEDAIASTQQYNLSMARWLKDGDAS